MEIKVGSAIKSATEAIGIKPCGGCLKTADLMDSGEIVAGLKMMPGNAVQMLRTKFNPLPVHEIEDALLRLGESMIGIHKVSDIIAVESQDSQEIRWRYHWAGGKLEDRTRA